jgi:transglutaminase-like putative cysteine protease
MTARRQEFWYMVWLTTAVLTVALPHLRHVPVWISATLYTLALWRLVAADKGWALPSARIRKPLVIAGLAGVLWSYHGITGVVAGTALLLVMVGLKLLETYTRRDRMVVAMICFVLMFASFLREQEVWSGAYLLIGVALTLIALLQSGTYSNRMPARAATVYTGKLLLQALPLMALLFVLFPRVPGPFWALPTDSGDALTGLPDSVSPGDITDLGRSDEIAFRVRFDGAVPPPAQRYWRGPVMSYFDGRAWIHRNRGEPPADLSVLRTDGPEYNYEITLEPHGRRWLLALETPSYWSRESAAFTSDWQLSDEEPVNKRLAYRARSTVNGTIPGEESQRYLQAMRYLPERRNPRARAFARELLDASGDDSAYLTRVLAEFRNQPFSYTLTPPKLGTNSTDEFLFDTQAGFCEHYASAFAVLARAAGIPARVVTGYLGAEHNPVGDYWVVRQSDAHAWTEVWIDGEWRRYDPTAAVAPERIELGLDGAIPEAGRSAALLIRRNAVFSQVALNIDALNAAWDQWILGFGPEAQRELLEKLGLRQPNLYHLLGIMLGGSGCFLLALSWWLARPGRPRPDPATRVYRRFCSAVAARFRMRLHNEAPAAFAAAAGNELPQWRDEIDRITQLYLRVRYEDSDATELDELRSRVRAFRLPG